MPSTRKYNAFISYYRNPDQEISEAIQKGLRKLGAELHKLRLRALAVFRDETDSSGFGSLNKRIREGIDSSDFMILVASKQGRNRNRERKDWVAEEVEYWLQTKQPMVKDGKVLGPRIIICVTDGNIEWNYKQEEPDFNWDVTDCLPQSLIGKFSEDPSWVDFREIKALKDYDPQHLTLDSSIFKQKIAEISSQLQGVTVDKLIAREAKIRRNLYFMSAGIFSLLLGLSGLAGYMTHDARIQRLTALQKDSLYRSQTDSTSKMRALAILREREKQDQAKIAVKAENEAKIQKDSASKMSVMAKLKSEEAERQKDSVKLARLQTKQANDAIEKQKQILNEHLVDSLEDAVNRFCESGKKRQDDPELQFLIKQINSHKEIMPELIERLKPSESPGECGKSCYIFWENNKLFYKVLLEQK